MHLTPQTVTTLRIEDLDQFKATPVPTAYPSNQRTFYAPYEDTHPVIMAVLGECKRSAVIGMYGWTDAEAAKRVDELLGMPHVFCQVNLDSSEFGGKTESEVLAIFHDDIASNTVAVGRSIRGQINHNKLAVVDGVWTISGSTNWSLNGEQRQNNQLTVTYDPLVAAEARHILDLEHAAMLTQMAARAKATPPTVGV